MPDVWTTNPERLRGMLGENHTQGIRCGEPPRVLTDRDPAWTCVMEWNSADVRWLGDIYIHDVRDIFFSTGSPFTWLFFLIIVCTLAIGVLVGRIAYRR